jgi:hypothetical protein
MTVARVSGLFVVYAGGEVVGIARQPVGEKKLSVSQVRSMVRAASRL